MCEKCRAAGLNVPDVATDPLEMLLFSLSDSYGDAVQIMLESGLTPTDFDEAGINALDALYRVGTGETPADILSSVVNIPSNVIPFGKRLFDGFDEDGADIN